MAKLSALPILEIRKDIKSGKFRPIYFLFGEDTYSINRATELLEQTLEPLINAGFDKTVFFAEKISIEEVLDTLNSFPFTGDKKLIILKELETKSEKEKEKLANYFKAPADFNFLIIQHEGKPSETKEYFKLLVTGGYAFEAKLLKDDQLIDWLISFAESRHKKLLPENAKVLLEIVGDNRSLLEMQIEKMSNFLGDQTEISLDLIHKSVAETKEFTMYNLQDAIALLKKEDSLKISLKLLSQGESILSIIGFLTRFFTILARLTELIHHSASNQEMALALGVHPYYLRSYIEAHARFSPKKMQQIVQALLDADISVKTSRYDEKTILTILVSVIVA